MEVYVRMARSLLERWGDEHTCCPQLSDETDDFLDMTECP